MTKLHIGGYSDDLVHVATEGPAVVGPDWQGGPHKLCDKFLEEYGDSGATVTVEMGGAVLGSYRIEFSKPGVSAGDWTFSMDIPDGATVTVAPDSGVGDGE